MPAATAPGEVAVARRRRPVAERLTARVGKAAMPSASATAVVEPDSDTPAGDGSQLAGVSGLAGPQSAMVTITPGSGAPVLSQMRTRTGGASAVPGNAVLGCCRKNRLVPVVVTAGGLVAPEGSSSSTPWAEMAAVTAVAGLKAGSIDAVEPSRLVTMTLLQVSVVEDAQRDAPDLARVEPQRGVGVGRVVLIGQALARA